MIDVVVLQFQRVRTRLKAMMVVTTIAPVTDMP